MSARLLPEDVLFFQRLLRAEGLYHDAMDGIWGPLTETASRAFETNSQELRTATRTFDARSESNIVTLSLEAQRQARLSLGRILDGGLNARIISGTRTYAQQDALYGHGRFGNPGPVVTKARGGQSNHNFGIAWDIGVFRADGTYVDDGPPYDQAAQLGLAPGIEWGGNWTNFPDKPHYQLRLDLLLADLRVAFESDTARPVFA